MSGAADERGETHLLFLLGEGEFGLSVANVTGIVRYEEPTPVPRSPDSVRGVVNLRGKVIPVLDLGERLGVGRLDPGRAARIVVAESSVGPVGLAVDATREVVDIPREALSPAPEGAVAPESSAMVSGVAEVQGRLVILLELDAVMPRTGNENTDEDPPSGEE